MWLVYIQGYPQRMRLRRRHETSFKYNESKSFALNKVFLWPIYWTNSYKFVNASKYKFVNKKDTDSPLRNLILCGFLCIMTRCTEVRSFMIRDVYVFSFFLKNDRFVDDEKSKTKRLFLKTIVF